jgi:hypothetical protein
MMREEFVKLTGVEISHRYYTDRIEPEYTDGEWADKQEFCTDWLKRNKSTLCKASSIDLSGLHSLSCVLAPLRQFAHFVLHEPPSFQNFDKID